MGPLFVNLGVTAAVAGTVGVVAHSHGLASGETAKWMLGGAGLGAFAVVAIAFEERMAPAETDPTVQGGLRGSVVTAAGTMLLWIVYGIVVGEPSAVVGGATGLILTAVIVVVRRRRRT